MLKEQRLLKTNLVHGAMGLLAELHTQFIVKLVHAGYLMATFIVMRSGDARTFDLF